MNLGTTENLLKRYDYYESSEGETGSLVLTDRRLVHITQGKHGESHIEMRVQDICAVQTGYRKITHRAGGMVMAVIGLVFALLVGILMPTLVVSQDIGGVMEIIFLPLPGFGSDFAINGVWLALGLLFVVIGLIKFFKMQMQLYLVVTTDRQPGMGLYMRAEKDDFAVDTKELKLGGDDADSISVSLNKDEAQAIVEELSAMIWQLQEDRHNRELAAKTGVPAAPAQPSNDSSAEDGSDEKKDIDSIIDAAVKAAVAAALEAVASVEPDSVDVDPAAQEEVEEDSESAETVEDQPLDESAEETSSEQA